MAADKTLKKKKPNGKADTREEKLKAAVYNASGDMDVVAVSMIHATLLPLYQTGKLSDLTVKCGDRIFRVHKAIVCAQSPFFDKACTGGFKEGSESTIDLPEEDPDTVDRFFQFLYAGNYSDGEHFDCLPSIPAMMTPAETTKSLEEEPAAAAISTNLKGIDESDDENYPSEDEDYPPEKDVQEEDPFEYASDSDYLDETSESDQSAQSEYLDNYPITSLPISLRVYVMADKYDVPALKLLAKERFTQTARNHWYGYDKFPAVIDELYESTVSSDPLRTLVCDLVSSCYRNDADLRVRMKSVMQRHSEFAIGVLDTFVASY